MNAAIDPAYAQQPDLRSYTDKVHAPGIVAPDTLTMSMVLEALEVATEQTGAIASSLIESLDPVINPRGVLFEPRESATMVPPGEAPAAAPIVLAIADKVGRITTTNQRLEALIRSLAL